jgi:hypothetical protein
VYERKLDGRVDAVAERPDRADGQQNGRVVADVAASVLDRAPVVKPSPVGRYRPLWKLTLSLAPNCPPGENRNVTCSRAGTLVTFPSWLIATTCQT